MTDKNEVLSRLSFEDFYKSELESFSRNGSPEVMTLCPFHDDQTPSLAVNVETGRYYCHACGAKGDVFGFYMARHQCGFKEALAALAEIAGVGNGNSEQKQGKARATPENIAKCYHYYGPDNEYAFSSVRFEEPGKDKTFRQWRYNFEAKEWVSNIQGVRLVPYRLPEVAGAETIYIVEGEKDANNLHDLGLPATCNPMGAGKWRAEYNGHFRGKHVVILPDNDDPGRKHAQMVSRALEGYAASIKVVELPGLPHKGDVSDWIEAGGTRGELENRVAQFRPWKPEQDKGMSCGFLSFADLVSAQHPIEWVIRGYIEKGTIGVVWGESKAMKSFITMDMGLCIAAGIPWHENDVPTPGAVFYICAEGHGGMRRRVQAWRIHHQVERTDIPFFTSQRGLPLLNAEAATVVHRDIQELANIYGSPELVIIDTLAKNMGGDENSTADMSAFVNAMDNIKITFDCSVLAVHHTGHSDKNRGRGSYALPAGIDFEYSMERATDGARILTNRKMKDGEDGFTAVFKPKVVPLGYCDPDTGDEYTSCVLVRTEVDAVLLPKQKLTGHQKTVFEALVHCINEKNEKSDVIDLNETTIHQDAWREQANKTIVTSTGTPDSKRMAFTNAVKALIEKGRVSVKDNYYWINQ